MGRALKLGEFIAALEKFFNDIMGTLIPGFILLIGLANLGILSFLQFPIVDLSKASSIFAIGILSYLTGHLIDQVNQRFAPSLSYKPKVNSSYTSFENWVHQYLAKQKIDHKIDASDEKVRLGQRSLRSVAMTLSADATYISGRFRFLELLFNSTATALVILAILTILLNIFEFIQGFPFSKSLLVRPAIFIVIAMLFYKRASTFGERSDAACFDCALATIIAPK